MRSGFGEVFLAKDKESSSLVAIKVVQYAPDGVDCDGILSLWVHSIILEVWESIEGG